VDIILKVKSKADQAVRSVRHPLNGRMILGRGPDSAVPLDAPGISREHLEVRLENSALLLTDLSSNGTWLNGARMPQRRKCKTSDGDLVELPGYEIRLQLVADPPPQPQPKPRTLPESGVNDAPRPASASKGKRAPSMMASVSALDLFLLIVVLMSAALLIFYLTS